MAPPTEPLPTLGGPNGAPNQSKPRTLRAAFVGGIVGAVVSAGVAYATVQLTDSTTTKTVTVEVPADAPGSTPSNAATTLPVAGTRLNEDTKVGLDLHGLIDKVRPSVVAISVGVKDGSGGVQALAAGSGVIISKDGLVLTNAHVVEAEDQFGRAVANPTYTLKMHDGTVREATVLGAAPDFDVALMRLNDTSNLTPIELGDSGEIRVGDDVVAVGNALDLGDSPTITKGIISALDRSLDVNSELTLYGLIQTDAPINHGNSGGALVDSFGRLIGINSAGIPDAQNIGFAIAINSIKPLLTDLEAGKKVTRTPTAFLGVNVSQTPDGVAITDVSDGSGASKAGVKAGDILKKVGDADISTIEQLGEVLRSISPGTSTPVAVLRDGQVIDLTVVMGSRAN